MSVKTEKDRKGVRKTNKKRRDLLLPIQSENLKRIKRLTGSTDMVTGFVWFLRDDNYS